jgi:hypothetical protein
MVALCQKPKWVVSPAAPAVSQPGEAAELEGPQLFGAKTSGCIFQLEPRKFVRRIKEIFTKWNSEFRILDGKPASPISGDLNYRVAKKPAPVILCHRSIAVSS